MKKFSTKTLIILLLLAVALFFLVSPRSGYAPAPASWAPIAQSEMDDMGPEPEPEPMYEMAPPSSSDYAVSGLALEDESPYADANLSGSINMDGGCGSQMGVGLASSLMPRDVATQEQYGQFAPDDILKGQNFLDPRQQVGWPETIGGNIRNGNQQLRADPPNPKDAYVWNNSTIVPDLMQRDLCT
jgi:hypothetical protein